MFDLTLTFDNGPDPETTPFVLDVLARRSLRTTFFVVGHKLSTLEGRRLARRAHEEGHWIGNHTWSHSAPLGLLEDPSAISEEIRGTQKAIGALAHPHRFFRPFGQGGNLDERLLNPTVIDVLTAERMSCVLWNAIPGDWKEPDGWVDRALAQCRAQPWTVMVLHDLPTGAVRNLERFLDAAVESRRSLAAGFCTGVHTYSRWTDRSAARQYSLVGRVRWWDTILAWSSVSRDIKSKTAASNKLSHSLIFTRSPRRRGRAALMGPRVRALLLS